MADFASLDVDVVARAMPAGRSINQVHLGKVAPVSISERELGNQHQAVAITQDVFIIGEGLSERARTTSKGTKSRFTLSVRVDPVIVNLNELALGAGPAEALRKAISDGIKAISETASPATLLKRKYAETAIQAGKRWATKRYAGGKMGGMAPNSSDKLFNDSGRLAAGVFVRQNPKEGSWTVNVPANRLDPSEFKDRGVFAGMVQRLRNLVPVLRDPTQSPHVRQAIQKTMEQMLVEAKAENWQAKLQVLKLGIKALQTINNALGV